MATHTRGSLTAFSPLQVAAICCLSVCIVSLSGSAQGQSASASGACPVQPVLESVDPPSGTTGINFPYEIIGSELDQVASLTLLQGDDELSTQIRGINGTAIQFIITAGSIRDGLATLTLTPADSECQSPSVDLDLRERDVLLSGIRPPNIGQIGTVFHARGCVPNECGDNSTTFDLRVGEIVLDLLDVTEYGISDRTGEVIARFPQTDSEPFITGKEILAVTMYNEFETGAFLSYQLPGTIDSVTPAQGQRGTEVVIAGDKLDGIGELGGVEIVAVLLGGYSADIVSASATEVVVRASSGSTVEADTSILIQSNQTLELVPGFTFEGPYLRADNLWTQLPDGEITNVIPPAAQAGSVLILCGERLSGGGTRIVSVEIAGQAAGMFDDTPFSTELTTAGSECITAVVPDADITGSGLRGDVTLEADTRAVVSTVEGVEFSYAEITEVNPNQGQVGTRVVISGVELLSGLNGQTPVVYLSGIEATLVAFSSTTVEVVVEDPPEGSGSPSASGVASASGMIPEDPGIFNTPGTVVIVVTTPDFGTPLSFNVSLDMGWTYLPPGRILDIFPNFGQYGTRITVMGENLLGYGQTLLNATVNGVKAAILNSSDTSVEIEAPDLNIIGLAPIVLFTDTGAQVTGSVQFQYRQRGVIENISPSRGQFGTYVTLTGTNLFGHGNTVSSVSFGDLDTEIDFTAATSTSIRVRVPMNNNTEQEVVFVRIIADTSAIVDSGAGELTWTYLVQGQVTMANPSQGQEGTNVIITGANLLGGGDSISSIFLDGVTATLADPATNTMISVVMGDIDTRTDTARGQVYIESNTGAIVSGGLYTHQSSGQIMAFLPAVGREGTRITITGDNLQGFGQNITSVEIAGVVGQIESQSNSEVVVRVAAASEGIQGPIVLRIDTGAIVSSADDNLFTYEQPGCIQRVSPSDGAEGSGVLISGVALRTASTRVESITFGGSPVDRIVTETESEMSVIAGPAPSENASSASITITASDGSYVSGMNFSYQEDLTISLPGRTSGQEGTRIEILLPDDDSFTASFDLRASIDDREATIVSVNPESMLIEVSVPRASRPGMYTTDVAVEGIDRLVARLPDSFTYIPEGVIYSVTPNIGQRGTQILLEGDNLLGGGTSISSAIIELSDGTQMNVMRESSTNNEVTLTIPENPTGASFPAVGDIILTADTNAIIRRLNAFTYVTPGQIDSFSPTTGQFGTYLTISGSNLLQGMSLSSSEVLVTVAGTDASVQDEDLEGLSTPPSNTQIIVRVQRSSDEAPLGAVEIILPSGATVTSRSGENFQYLPGNIESVSPSTGTVNTRVDITGSNLYGGGSPQQVFLGGVEAMISTIVSDSMIIVTAQTDSDPETSPSDVEIIADTGAVVTGEGLWTYESPGRITAISPRIGQQGVVVTITGESFLGSDPNNFIQGCVLAGVPGQVISSTNEEVECVASAMSEAQTDIVHIVAQSGAGVQSDPSVNFTYYPAQIDQIDPPSGSNGTFVTITGLNLLGIEDSNFEVRNITFGSIVAAVIDISPSGGSITTRVGESQGTSSGDTVRVTSTSGAYLELATAWSYTEPGVIRSITPDVGFPGETITITGENLVPPVICVPGRNSLRVILGQSESYSATQVNDTTIEFRPGVFQGQETTNEPIPIQVIAPSGATVFTDAILFSYNATGNVTSVTPVAGGAGSEVVITGMELLSGGTNVTVTLAGFEATIVRASETEVVVMAGAGPTTEPELTEGISGPVVIEADNGRLVGLPGSAWMYLPVLSPSFVSPSTGQNGTFVTIENFSRLSPSNYTLEGVTLTGVPADIVGEGNDGSLLVRAGPTFARPLGDIVLQFSSDVNLIIPDAWSYQPPVVLNSVTPGNGYFGTVVTLSGSNFQAGGVSVNEVTLAGLSTEIISQTDSTLEVRITQMVNSSTGEIDGNIVITSDQGATFSSITTFSYVQVDIQSIAPNRGQGGTVVSIEGVGLLLGGTSVTTVSFDEQEASNFSASDTAIVIAAPASAVAVSGVNISYSVNTEANISLLQSWEYVAPGEITAVSPAQGNNGTIVTITGNMMFGGGSQAVSVFLGDVPATEILVNSELLVQVRAGYRESPTTAGSSSDDELRVTIVADTGSVTTSNVTSGVIFEYLEPGQITSIDPTSGQAATIVTIQGMGLSEDGEAISRVWLAGVQAVIVVSNTTTGVVTVEAGRPNVQEAFDAPVTIESTRGTLTYSSQNFTYNREGVVTLVEPRQGQVGTRVRITGERLRGGGTTVEAVYLVGVEAEIQFERDDEIRVIANTSTVVNNDALGDIVIKSNTGATIRSIDSWTYVTPGTIAAVMPPEGQFGTTVTINGTGLLSGGTSLSAVYIGDILAYDILSSSDTEVVIRAGSPNSTQPLTTDSFTFVSNFGGILIFNTTWSYLTQSNIINVDPAIGMGRDSVELFGTNLLGGGTRIMEVATNDILATAIDSDSNDTYIKFTVGLNPTGIGSTGDIVVTSDSGALTIEQNGWTYEDECPVGEFGTFNSCLPCDLQCSSCFGPTDFDCFNCSAFQIVLANSTMYANSTMQCVSQCTNVSTVEFQCVDRCNSDQYAQADSIQQASFCLECNSLCDPNHSCSGPNATQCGRCVDFYDTTTGSCVITCPNSTFADESNRCIPCDAQCSPEAGCDGPTAADCVQCRNFIVEVGVIDTSTTDDLCVSNCAEAYYQDGQYCRPCSSECAGGCSGPNPTDCLMCRSFSFVSSQNGTVRCVSTCNPDPARITMYGDVNGICQRCSSLCSLTGGCIGPNATNCISGCRIDPETSEPLPMLDVECVLRCPSTSHYHDRAANMCVPCNPSCSDGCTGPRSSDCIEEDDEDEPFSAGAGTIAIVVVVVVFLLIIVVCVIVAFLVWRFYKHRSYKVENAMELGETDADDRYSRAPLTQETQFAASEEKSKTLETKETVAAATTAAVGASNAAFEDGELYTEMGPEDQGGEKIPATSPFVEVAELYADVAQEGNQQASEPKEGEKKPSPTAPDRPEKPKPQPPSKPPAPLPEAQTEKPPPPRPPTPEMYTDMTASVQEVYVNPTADDEYSEMLPNASAVTEDFYEDAGSVMTPPAAASQQPSSKAEEKDPLLSTDAEYGNVEPELQDNALYEDTDVAIAAAEEYKVSVMGHVDQPPELPARSIPKRKSSAPLPETPLEKSIKERSSAVVQEEDLYIEADVPIEESLYEAIPGGIGARLLPDDSPPPQPKKPPPPAKRGGKKPPKSESAPSLPSLPPKPKPRKT